MEKTNFRDILTQYKTIFFDAYGVIKNYNGLIPGIQNTFQTLDALGISYFVLTNDASRGPRELAHSYQKRGLPQITSDKIISSGMLAREYLRLKVKQGTLAYLGTRQSAHYIETLGLKTISIGELNLDHADEISAVVFLDDEGFDWYQDINKVVNLIRQQNIPVVIANTDTSYPVSTVDINIAIGGLADLVEKIVGKKFIRFGKPDAQMFIFAYEHSVAKGGTENKAEILMVGDTLHTDIMGGNKFGLDTALVLTGNTLPKQAEMYINTLGIVPTYLMDHAVVKD